MKKPDQDEYPSTSYFPHYINKVENKNILEALTIQSSIVYDLFKNLTPDQHFYAYAAGKWSLQEVLGHITDVERVFSYRALCIARGEKQNLPGFDENDYVEKSHFREMSFASLLLQYKLVRDSSLALFSTFSEETGNRRGNTNGNEVTVRALICLIAGHEMHHLDILREKYNIY